MSRKIVLVSERRVGSQRARSGETTRGPFNRRRGTEPNSSPRKLPTSIGFHYASGSRYHCTVSIRPWVKIGMISSRVSTESFGFDGVSHYISPAREAECRTFGCLVVRLAKSTCGPRPKFVWPRREPLYACLDAAAYVPDDGGREPGTGILRSFRGVRGPRDTRDVSHRGAGRTRPQGRLGTRLLPERRTQDPHARRRLRRRRVEVLRHRLENCETEPRTRARAVVDCDGPPSPCKCGWTRGPEVRSSVPRGEGRS